MALATIREPGTNTKNDSESCNLLVHLGSLRFIVCNKNKVTTTPMFSCSIIIEYLKKDIFTCAKLKVT